MRQGRVVRQDRQVPHSPGRRGLQWQSVPVRSLVTTLVVALGLVAIPIQAQQTHESGAAGSGSVGAETGGQSGAEPSTGASEEAGRLLRAWADTGRFMGTAVVVRAGEIVLATAHGWANVEEQTPSTLTTEYRMGSLSKGVTAAAVLQLVDDGLLDLSAAVTEYLPEFPQWAGIDLHQLLTHTSGIADYTETPQYAALAGRPIDTAGLLGRIAARPLRFTPGSSFGYSNSNYVLLAAVIERVTGTEYGEHVRTRLLAPSTPVSAVAGPEARGYIFTGDDYAPSSPLDLSQALGAGSLVASPLELAGWYLALLEGEVLSPEALALMTTPHIAAGVGPEGAPYHYGYGWFLGEDGGRARLSHSGGINGFSSRVDYYPDEQLLVLVLANVDLSPVGEIAGGLGAVFLGESVQLPAVRPAAAVEAELLERYVGGYLLASGSTFTIELDSGRLYLRSGDGPRFALFPSSPTEFFMRNAPLEVVFVADESSGVLGLLMGGEAGWQPARKTY